MSYTNMPNRTVHLLAMSLTKKTQHSITLTDGKLYITWISSYLFILFHSPCSNWRHTTTSAGPRRHRPCHQTILSTFKRHNNIYLHFNILLGPMTLVWKK